MLDVDGNEFELTSNSSGPGYREYRTVRNVLPSGTYQLVLVGLDGEKTITTAVTGGDPISTVVVNPTEGDETTEWVLTFDFRDSIGHNFIRIAMTIEDVEPITQTVSFYKVDEEEYQLAGATFELRGGEETLTATSDDNGTVSFGEVEVGEYTLVETVAPEGYVLDDTERTVTVTEDGVVIEGLEGFGYIMNEPVVVEPVFADLTFFKLNEDGYALEGAVFTLVDAETNEALGTATFDAEGTVFFGELDTEKTYYVYKSQAPEGYVLDSTPRYVTFTDDGAKLLVPGQETETTVVENVLQEEEPVEPAVFDIHFFKRDEEYYPLADAIFNLVNRETNEIVLGATSDADGNIRFADVPEGEYYLYEAQAPEGYIVDTTPHFLTVTENGVNWRDHDGLFVYITNEKQEQEEPEDPEDPEDPEPPIGEPVRIGYDANGGRFRRGAQTEIDTVTGVITLATRSELGAANPGHIFLGWRVRGTDEILPEGSEYTLTGPVVFEAVWQKI